MRTIPLLAALEEAEFAAVLDRMTEVHLDAGAVVFEEGDPGDALYVVVTGRLLARQDGRLLGDLRRGEPVGEMALLTGEPRSASVTAARDSTLLRLSRQDFEALVADSPHLAIGLARGIVRRLDRGNRPEAALSDVVAVVRGTPGVDVSGVGRQLAAAMGVGWWRHDDALAALGSDGEAREADLARWLGRLEEDAHPLLLEAEGPDSWRRFACSHADVVVVLADGRQPPAAGVLPEHGEAAVHLVFEQGGPHTAAWLDELRPQQHHHLLDVERLARALRGRSVVLVLGGGAARGFAHAGVLRALAERHVSVDAVVGTSMGAVVGGLWASGRTVEEITEGLRRVFVEGKVFDVTLPVVALIRARHLADGLRQLFGDSQIEQMPLPFCCVSASLVRAAIVEHDRGPAWRAIKASGSIPALGPPVVHEDDLLVDGGVLANLPVHVARRRHTGVVITVSATPRIERTALPVFDENAHPMRHLLDRGLKRGGPPSLLSVLLRSAYLASTATLEREREASDVWLAPDLAGFRGLETRRLEDIVAVGYHHARQVLDQPDVRATLGLSPA